MEFNSNRFVDVKAIQVNLKILKPSDDGSKMEDFGYFALSLGICVFLYK
jgi:hypothetical protein